MKYCGVVWVSLLLLSCSVEGLKANLTLRGHHDEIWSAKWSPDGQQIATASWDKLTKIWDSQTGQELATLSGHKKKVNSVDWHPDGNRVVTASGDSMAIVWDTSTGQNILTLKGHDGEVLSAIYSSDGRMIATAGWDQLTKVWDGRSGQLLFSLSGHNSVVSSATWNSDGTQILTSSYDGTAKVWDVQAGRLLLTLNEAKDDVLAMQPMSAVYSPDGKRILTVCQTAKIWDATTGQELVSLPPELQIFGSQSFPCWSPNGDHIAIEVRSEKTDEVKVYDGKTGKEILNLGSVHSVSWGPDGKKIVAANWQGQPSLFDAKTGHSLIQKAGKHIGPIWVVDWSPNGQRFLTASADNTTKVWTLPQNQF